MYGCADPVVIYGFGESSSDVKINAEWLQQNNLHMFTDNIVRNCACTMYYGVEAELNTLTGHCIIPETDKERVDNIANKLGITAGFHVVVYGWDVDEHDSYNPDEDEELVES